MTVTVTVTRKITWFLYLLNIGHKLQNLNDSSNISDFMYTSINISRHKFYPVLIQLFRIDAHAVMNDSRSKIQSSY